MGGAVAVASLKWYFVDVAIGQAGEPDRSMLFWGLPIVFIGIAAGTVAAILGILAYKALTRTES